MPKSYGTTRGTCVSGKTTSAPPATFALSTAYLRLFWWMIDWNSLSLAIRAAIAALSGTAVLNGLSNSTVYLRRLLMPMLAK